MREDSRSIYVGSIAPSELVVDVGGGANPCVRADYVIDGLSYEQRGALGGGKAEGERFSRLTWTQLDLCARQSWPFQDKFFDVALCTHVLEDLRDPVWVCSEISRIAKRGYVEVPSRILEQSLGVEHPRYAGFYHHRWLVSTVGRKLMFRLKPHCLHVVDEAIVTRVGANETINPIHANLAFEWSGSLDAAEVLCFDEQDVGRELCSFARDCRGIPDLKVPFRRPWIVAFKRWVYYTRLKFGW